MTHFSNPNVSAILHRSRCLEYRDPFGAAACGTYVTLALDISYDCVDPVLCYAYGLYSLSYHEQAMRKKIVTERHKRVVSENRYEITLRMPAEPGLLFYWFKIFRSGFGDCFYYVRSTKDLSGAGRVSDGPARVGAGENRSPHAFQITVFDKKLRTPDWMKGAMIYQIFPDRFSRSEDFSYEKMTSIDDRSERIYHFSWDEDVDIDGKPETGYVACDFFGGSLKGIAEKADYLKRLHIELLYLNPIFKARSNHRYDTGDYLEIDPILGGEAGFTEFAKTMKNSDIRFILDGVFNHTGADSRYFNKYGRYPGKGAYQALTEGGQSPYSSWYSFSKSKSGEIHYDSWWGFPELPNVNENDLSFRDFILGDGGVVAHWIRKGASGFRLDVSDELPDSFIRDVKSRVSKETEGLGVVLGEVWEDASNKVSYGTYRDFILGRTHDSVMGYPFRDAVVGFLAGSLTAREADHILETYRENYPPEIYYCVMNLLSSHDIPRAVTALSGARDPGDRRKQKETVLTAEQFDLGMKLHRLGFVIQVGYVGCPAIYYGDEVGMDGFRDPMNRRTYPWGRISEKQKEQLMFFTETGGLRGRLPVLKTGFYRTISADEDLWVFERSLDSESRDIFGEVKSGPRRMIFAINRNREHSVSFSITDADRLEMPETNGTRMESAMIESIALLEDKCEQSVEPAGFRIFSSDF